MKLPNLKIFSNSKILSPLKHTSSTILPLVSGIEIGVPLNIISKISTGVNFPYDILTKECIILNFLLGFTTYKQDRYLDSLEYNKKYGNMTQVNDKHDYYLSILNNDKHIQFILFISYISICILSIYYQMGILIPLFSSTFMYKYFKQNKYTSFLKPFYVASMWTICTNIIPLLLLDNYDNSMITYQLISPSFFNIFALTNLADLKDYEEDLNNNIRTLPIILGKNNAKYMIYISSLIFFIMFINSEYFIWNLENTFYIISNVFPILIL